VTNEDRQQAVTSKPATITPPPPRWSPLRGQPARQVKSNSTQSTANPVQGLAGESTPGYPPPLPKLPELGVRPGYRLPAAIKGPRRVPTSPRTSPSRTTTPPKPPSATAFYHHSRLSPDVVDLPPQAIPAQGEHRGDIPSIPPQFSPFPRPPPTPGAPPAATGRGRPAFPCLDREGGEVEEGVLPIPPCPFPLFQQSPLLFIPPPLYSPSLFLSIRPQPLNYSPK
jgi:hypothetical protein